MGGQRHLLRKSSRLTRLFEWETRMARKARRRSRSVRGRRSHWRRTGANWGALKDTLPDLRHRPVGQTHLQKEEQINKISIFSSLWLLLLYYCTVVPLQDKWLSTLVPPKN